jgi:hypothetical protein
MRCEILSAWADDCQSTGPKALRDVVRPPCRGEPEIPSAIFGRDLCKGNKGATQSGLHRSKSA